VNWGKDCPPEKVPLLPGVGIQPANNKPLSSRRVRPPLTLSEAQIVAIERCILVCQERSCDSRYATEERVRDKDAAKRYARYARYEMLLRGFLGHYTKNQPHDRLRVNQAEREAFVFAIRALEYGAAYRLAPDDLYLNFQDLSADAAIIRKLLAECDNLVPDSLNRPEATDKGGTAPFVKFDADEQPKPKQDPAPGADVPSLGAWAHEDKFVPVDREVPCVNTYLNTYQGSGWMGEKLALDANGSSSQGQLGCLISVYIDTGVVFEYRVADVIKGREHAAAIIRGGYRHTAQGSGDLEWFAPHRVDKVLVQGGGESSGYRDVARAT